MKNSNRGQVVFWVVFAVAIVGLAALLAGGVYAPASQPQASNFTPFYPPSSSGALDFGGFGGNGGGGGGEVRGGGPFLECVIDFCVNPVTGRRVDENSPVRCMAPSKTTFCGSQECVNSGLACIESGGFGMGSTKDGGFSEGGNGSLGGGGSDDGGESDRSINDCPYITQPDVECDGKWIINENTCTSECVRGKSGPSGGGCPVGSSYCDSGTTKWDTNKQKCVAKSGGGGGKLCGTTNPITCSAGQICVATIGGAVGEDGRSRIGFECVNGKIDDWLDSEFCGRNLFYNHLNYDNADVVCVAP